MDKCPQFGSPGRCFDCLEKPSCPPAAQAPQESAEDRLARFFREERFDLGSHGDYELWSTVETAMHFLRMLPENPHLKTAPATQAGDALVEMRDLIRNAFIEGAEAVHNAWLDGNGQREADFGEAGDDYAASVDFESIIARETAAAQAEERAKVVAWLRRCGEGRPTNSDDHIAAASAFTVSADAIERGQHKETGDADQV